MLKVTETPHIILIWYQDLTCVQVLDQAKVLLNITIFFKLKYLLKHNSASNCCVIFFQLVNTVDKIIICTS